MRLKPGNRNGRNAGELASIHDGPTVRDCAECIAAKCRRSKTLRNEGSLITIRLVARPPLWLSGSHLLCLFTCKSVVNKYYCDAVLSISA